MYTVEVPPISKYEQNLGKTIPDPEKTNQIYKTWADQFYGHMNGDQYIEGNLSKMLKEAASSPDTQHYIVSHGDFNPEMIECQNTLLDDNKKLSCVNGEKIDLPPNCRLIYVTDSDTTMTPASISRLGIFNMQ